MIYEICEETLERWTLYRVKRWYWLWCLLSLGVIPSRDYRNAVDYGNGKWWRMNREFIRTYTTMDEAIDHKVRLENARKPKPVIRL